MALLPDERAANEGEPSTLSRLSSLQGRVALITGGAGEIGRAMAGALAELGATIVLADLRKQHVEDAAAALSKASGSHAAGFVVDLSDAGATRALPADVANRFGRLDIVINNAALVGTSDLAGWAVPFEQQNLDTWRRAMEINLTAAFVLSQASVPWLRASRHGCIVNIGSIYAVSGPDWRLYDGTSLGNPAAYAASKGGLLQLTRWLATTLAPDVRVNMLSPGGVYRGQDEAFVQKYVARTPLGRMAREDDFKGAVAFLASDLSAYVTGQHLVVDGGWTAW